MKPEKLVYWWLAVAMGMASILGAIVVWFTLISFEARMMLTVIGVVAGVSVYLGYHVRGTTAVRYRRNHRK